MPRGARDRGQRGQEAACATATQRDLGVQSLRASPAVAAARLLSLYLISLLPNFCLCLFIFPSRSVSPLFRLAGASLGPLRSAAAPPWRQAQHRIPRNPRTALPASVYITHIRIYTHTYYMYIRQYREPGCLPAAMLHLPGPAQSP